MKLEIETKKNDFLEHSLKAFNDKDLNEARKSAEAFCKIIILNEFGEEEGTKIITSTHPIIQKYDFNLAIESILFKNKIKNNVPLIHKKNKSYLLVLQNHGNLKSHDEDYSKLDISEQTFCLMNLNKLINFMYIEYFNEEIPNSLKILIDSYSQDLKKDIANKNTDWKDVIAKTNNFSNQQQKFLMITDKVKENSILSNLSNLDWAYIGDFDSNSFKDGLYKNLSPSIQEKRDLNIITIEEQKLIYSKSTTFWEYLDGYSPNIKTLNDTFRSWQKNYIYSGKLKRHILELYNGGVAASDSFIMIFWEDINRLNYLFDYLNIIDDVFSNNTNILFFTKNDEIRNKIIEELDSFDNLKNVYNIYDISIEIFSVLLNEKDFIHSEDIILPAFIDSNETSIKINHIDFLRYKDDLKIYPINYDNETIICEDFFKGKDIEFSNLHNDCDIYRDISSEIENIVRNRLNNRNNQLIYLISEPSAGTTTICNRILWNIKNDYPSFELVSYKKQNTFEFLQKVYSSSNKPILIFADHKIAEENIKSLVAELNTKNITFVIIYVNRFLDKNEAIRYKQELKNPTKISYNIVEELSRKEKQSFYNKLGEKYPQKRSELLNLRNSNGGITPFHFLFTVFLENYDNLDKYIEDRIKELNDYQQNRTLYLALIQYYTGLDVSVRFLTNKIDKYSLYDKNKSINNLITYGDFEDEIKIEFIHNIVCSKIIEKISGVNSSKAWKQKLAGIGIEFLEFISKHHAHNKDSDFIKDIVNRLFIKRNITTYDTENRSAIKYYTDFIEDLNSNSSPEDSKESIFKKLVEIYPEDRHYMAHLGRFYSVDKDNLEKALEYIDKSIELAEEQGSSDSILFHIKGMAYFRRIKILAKEKENIDTIIKYAKLSSECFKISRESDTQINNEYPFVSHARMLLTVLSYGKEIYDDIYSFIEKYKYDDFITNIIDNIENLVSDFEVIRSKSDDFSDMKQIKSDLWALQGDIGKSLEMLNNLLDKNTYYNPVIRRNIVRLNIKKYKENINEIPNKQITVLIQHIKRNLDSFSLEESNSTDILLWLRLIRHENIQQNTLDIIETLTYIKSVLNEENHLTKIQKNIQIIILYYLMIMKFIQYINGDNDTYSDLIEIKKELKNKAMYLDGKSLPREWLHVAQNKDLKKILNWYDSRLKWVNEDKFFDKQSEEYLEKCVGIIKEIQSQKTGTILYKNIDIHFIPRTDFTTSDINKEVEFYLSFSYDQMSAWKVKYFKNYE